MAHAIETRTHAWLGHLLFWPALAVWTWKLVEPNPVPEAVGDWLDAPGKFLVAKTLHFSGYAFLTFVLAIWVPPRRRPLVLAFTLMLFHGVASELIQTMVPNRSGRAVDVMIDWAGILTGVIFGWRFWWKVLIPRPDFTLPVAPTAPPSPTPAPAPPRP